MHVFNQIDIKENLQIVNLISDFYNKIKCLKIRKLSQCVILEFKKKKQKNKKKSEGAQQTLGILVGASSQHQPFNKLFMSTFCVPGTSSGTGGKAIHAPIIIKT